MINKKMMGTMAALGMMFIGSTAISAQTNNTIDSGSTPVIYDNRSVLEDGNAQYGMVIPTAISFTDDKKEADASVEIVGINGFNLDNDWTELDVTASVQSKNGYKLMNGTKSVAYKLEMDRQVFTGNTVQQINKKFGLGGTPADKVKKVTGKASLTEKATEKGQYSDTLTYTFTENTNTPT